MSEYDLLIEKATECLNKSDLQTAEEFLQKAITLNTESARAFNLFGILAEYRGNYALAAKYYRVANALEPSYTPSIVNLDRIVGSSRGLPGKTADFGIAYDDDGDESEYDIAYDGRGIGHIKRKRAGGGI